MAVTSHDKAWAGSSGTKNASGGTYAAKYKVWTNDPLDNTEVVTAYMVAQIGDIGTPYVYGNDSDSASFLESISPQRSTESNTQWEVTLNYAPATGGGEQQPDTNGDPSSDPTDWEDSIDEDSFTITLPVEIAQYHSGFTGNAAREREPGSIGPVINSAGMPFVPGLERDFEITTVRRQWYSTSAAATEALRSYKNKVNLIPYNVTRTDMGYVRRWDKYTARVKKITASYRRINNFQVWLNTVEIWINEFGWRANVVDRGRVRRAYPGDPDGFGGSVVGSIPTISNGKSWVTPITDARGEPVSDDVLLDGDGQPKRPYQKPVILVYSKYPEVDFSRLLMHHN